MTKNPLVVAVGVVAAIVMGASTPAVAFTYYQWSGHDEGAPWSLRCYKVTKSRGEIVVKTTILNRKGKLTYQNTTRFSRSKGEAGARITRRGLLIGYGPFAPPTTRVGYRRCLQFPDA